MRHTEGKVTVGRHRNQRSICLHPQGCHVNSGLKTIICRGHDVPHVGPGPTASVSD